jgi:hypothetical protein
MEGGKEDEATKKDAENKAICAVWFEPETKLVMREVNGIHEEVRVIVPNSFVCKSEACRAVIGQPSGRGYTNRMNHLNAKIHKKDYMRIFLEQQQKMNEKGRELMATTFVDSRSTIHKSVFETRCNCKYR